MTPIQIAELCLTNMGLAAIEDVDAPTKAVIR